MESVVRELCERAREKEREREREREREMQGGREAQRYPSGSVGMKEVDG